MYCVSYNMEKQEITQIYDQNGIGENVYKTEGDRRYWLQMVEVKRRRYVRWAAKCLSEEC